MTRESSTSSLLGTPEAEEWLDQFDPGDRQTAVDLLAAVELVSEDTFRLQLTRLIESTADSLSGPIALIPIREMGFHESYYAVKAGANAKARLLSANDIGSEVLCAQIASLLTRRSPSKFLKNRSLPNLRERRCRHFVFLDDLVGSGRRAEEFLDAFERSKTIKSWFSLGCVDFHLITYGITERGRVRLSRRHRGVRIHAVEVSPTIFNSVSDIDRISQLCNYYSNRTTRREIPLGEGGVGVLSVFSHGCPNNAPPILWAGSRNWSPLFPGRTIPTTLMDLFRTTNPWRRVLKRLERFFGSGPSRVTWNDDTSRMFLLLAATKGRGKGIERIAERSGLPLSECERLLRKASEFGWISGLRITKAGRAELSRAKSFQIKRVEKSRPIREGFYYPTSLG